MKWTLGGQEVQNHWDGTNRWEKPKHTARPRKGQAPSSQTQYQNKYASLLNEGKTPQGSQSTDGTQRVAREAWDRMSKEEKDFAEVFCDVRADEFESVVKDEWPNGARKPTGWRRSELHVQACQRFRSGRLDPANCSQGFIELVIAGDKACRRFYRGSGR